MWTINSFYNPFKCGIQYAKNSNTEAHVVVFEFVNSINKETHLDYNYTLAFT
jgi:hypothetical protein